MFVSVWKKHADGIGPRRRGYVDTNERMVGGGKGRRECGHFKSEKWGVH